MTLRAASALTEPYWEATRDKRGLVQWCDGCDTGISWPRAACPGCLTGEHLRRRPSGGHRVRHQRDAPAGGDPMMADRVPDVIAPVDLDDGIPSATNVVGCDPHDVMVGTAVRLAWEPLGDGRNLPLLTAAG